MNESLKKLSAKTDTSVSEIVRQYIAKGMSITGYKEETEFLRNQIREEINAVLIPNIERIVKLTVKSGIVSAGAYFLCASALSELVAPSVRQDFTKLLEESKKLAIAYYKDNSSFNEALGKFKMTED